jgi:hypothetical protein
LSVRAVWLIGCILLAGCDQRASVGTIAPDDGATPPSDAGHDAGALDAALEDAGRDAGEACPIVPFAVCDPVRNTGCSGALGMQCAIDYARTLTGYCIFMAPPTPGMLTECFNSGITESCPATFTCFQDRCERLCTCDADCDAGTCCNQPVDATGFSVCTDC